MGLVKKLLFSFVLEDLRIVKLLIVYFVWLSSLSHDT